MIEKSAYGYIARNDAVRVEFFFGLAGIEYKHAFYEVHGTPEELIRIGVCVPCADNVSGVAPFGERRAGGRLRVRGFGRQILSRDHRFKAAMARVIDGSPCVDFALPKPPRGRKRKPVAKSQQPVITASEEELIAALRALPDHEHVHALHAALKRVGFLGLYQEGAGKATEQLGARWQSVLREALSIELNRRQANDDGAEAA